MVNGYVATDTVIAVEMAERGETKFASITEDDIDIIVQNKDSKNTKKIKKPLLQFFMVIYLKKDIVVTLHICHWKNYVNY